MMSAQETIPGHVASSCDLASSTTSKPLRPKFATALLSADGPGIKTEPSQPCNADDDVKKKIRNGSDAN